MAIFCHKCGTKNEVGAGFCENCGVAQRQSIAAPFADQQSIPPGGFFPVTGSVSGSGRINKLMFASVATAVLLVGGGLAAYFALKMPEPSRSNLVAAAKVGYGKEGTEQARRALCLSNIDYGNPPFNAREEDMRTRAWLDALVAAGLFSPPTLVSSGGMFPQTLAQYAGTTDLAKYREGSRLCVAKAVEIVDVLNIGKPQEVPLGLGGDAPKVTAVKAELVLEATDVAPWMEKAEVRAAVLALIGGWKYSDKKLQHQFEDSFGLSEGEWKTGSKYKVQFGNQEAVARKARKDSVETKSSGSSSAGTSSTGLFNGIANAFSNLFNFGGHPLQGTWEMDTDGTSLGSGLASTFGGGGKVTFTSNSIDIGGQSLKCKFEVEGQRVKVIPEGQVANMTFVMLDKNSATMDMGFMQLKYKRVH